MTIHTVSSLQRSSRRLDRRRASVEGALAAMRHGATLHLQFGPTKAWWVLSCGWALSPDIAEILIARPEVQAVGDTLFPGTRSQTWRFIESREPHQ